MARTVPLVCQDGLGGNGFAARACPELPASTIPAQAAPRNSLRRMSARYPAPRTAQPRPDALCSSFNLSQHPLTPALEGVRSDCLAVRAGDWSRAANSFPMTRATTRSGGRAAGSRSKARRPRIPIRQTPPRRKRAPSRSARQQRTDLVGGGLLALGAFLAFVEYLGWDGGVIGLKIDTAVHLAIGRAAAVVPPLLVALGAGIFLRSPLTRLRPLRTGAIVCLATLVLALSTTDTGAVEHHGGLAGTYARIALNGLVGPIGVSILVALGTLAGVVLVTGASLRVAMRSCGRHVARAGRGGGPL